MFFFVFLRVFFCSAEVSNVASPLLTQGSHGSSGPGKRRGPNPLSTYLKDR